jgi:hypothetical protein
MPMLCASGKHTWRILPLFGSTARKAGPLKSGAGKTRPRIVSLR